MKHTLALLLLSCVLVAQDKPSSSAIQSIDPALVKNVSGGSVVESPIPADVSNPAKAKPAIPPVNVRDELIELIQDLKKDAGRNVRPISFISTEIAAVTWHNYETDVKAKTEAQRLLLQALLELAKLPVDSPLHLHSSSAELKDAPLKRGSRTR